jgi:hypothetical protein
VADLLKSIFTQFPFLTYLDFQGRGENPSLGDIYDHIFTKAFPQLRVFRLYTNLIDSLNQDLYYSVSYLLCGLTRVDLPGIMLKHMISICKVAINLETISVTDMVLDKKFITPFVQQLSNLKYLRKLEFFQCKKTYIQLQSNRLYNDLLIEMIGSKLKDRLQYFTIRQFDNWSMETIDIWFDSLPYWKSLYILDMNGCFSFKNWTGQKREYVKNLLQITELYGSFVISHSVK